MKIVRVLERSEKFDYGKIHDFLYFMDQLIPLTDKKLKRIFDEEITKRFGGNITMGIMEAVREQILDEGIEKGIEKGRHEEALEIARNLRNKNISIDIITEVTGLTIEEIEAL